MAWFQLAIQGRLEFNLPADHDDPEAARAGRFCGKG